MGDLHSIAYTNNNKNIVSAASSSLDSDWDFEMNNNVGVFNASMSHHNSYMENTPPSLSSFEHDQYSSGYLQDALFELGDRSKRRRLILFAGDQTNSSQICMNSIQGYWDSSDSSTTENSGEDLCCLAQIKTQTSIHSGSCTGLDDDNNIAIAAAKLSVEHDSFSSSSLNNPLLGSLEKATTLEDPSTLTSPQGREKFEERTKKILKRRSPNKITRVVYPFAMVKPPGGGVEGAFTLNDINERILMPPTRPLRHPVGDYACRPVLSPQGPGLSGKTVVAFTRIQTQGRGTITIIRTKG